MYIHKHITVLKEMLDRTTDREQIEALAVAIEKLETPVNIGSIIEPPDKEEFAKFCDCLNNLELADKYFVSLQTIIKWKSRYSLIRVPFDKKVSDAEFEEEYVTTTPIKDLAEKWGVTAGTIHHRACFLKLTRPKTSSFKDRVPDKQFQLEYETFTPIDSLATKWNVAVSTIRKRAYDLALNRPCINKLSVAEIKELIACSEI